MKKIGWMFCLLFFACEVEDTVPETPANDDYDTTNAILLKKGDLIGIGHTASGVASLYELDGKRTVVLDPYSSQNGPDLKIYLSADPGATEYIRLGNLKSTMGKQSYPVPDETDISKYPYIHVWCEKYTVVFAQAEIK
jgi:hypothetical protein